MGLLGHAVDDANSSPRSIGLLGHAGDDAYSSPRSVGLLGHAVRGKGRWNNIRG